MSEITKKLETFIKKNGREILTKFDAVLKGYDLPAPLTVLEAKISYSPNQPSGQKVAEVIYEDDEVIIIKK